MSEQIIGVFEAELLDHTPDTTVAFSRFIDFRRGVLSAAEDAENRERIKTVNVYIGDHNTTVPMRIVVKIEATAESYSDFRNLVNSILQSGQRQANLIIDEVDNLPDAGGNDSVYSLDALELTTV